MKGKALMFIRSVIVLASVTAVVTLGARAQAATHSAALARTIITVETHNSIFKFSAKTAPRGVVIFKVTNPASFRHNFTIKGRTTPVLSTGQSATLRVTFLRKGRYTYKDTLDHHASFGMKGVFTIT